MRQAYIQAVHDSEIAISAITQAEILYGLHKKPDMARLRVAFENFSARTRILSWDASTANSYAVLRTDLERSGRALDLMDLLIASQALAHGAVLITGDKAFRHAPANLAVDNWATDV